MLLHMLDVLNARGIVLASTSPRRRDLLAQTVCVHVGQALGERESEV